MSAEIFDIGGAPVIIGAGLAGLMVAHHLAPQPVVVLSAGPLGADAASVLSQGGIAAAMGADDHIDLHVEDTLRAGDGLCDEGVVRRVIAAIPEAIEHLARLGVAFDRGEGQGFRLGLEAAHARRRIVHAEGDATGRVLIRTLVDRIRRTPSITVLEQTTALRLVVAHNQVVGVMAGTAQGVIALPTRRVVMATGGIGSLFQETTNPNGAIGPGLALAGEAGAVLANLEFVQFHPTALDVPCRPMPLISEAVRGEGAVLVNSQGERFLERTAGAELGPRDVVARAIALEIAAGRRVFLDARECLGRHFAQRFPAITTTCRAAGIDPATAPIPVRPAAHYHMGGIAVDGEGRSSVAGLWACGEVACTGLHGANRLASNSLAEAITTAAWVADSVGGTFAGLQLPRFRDIAPVFPDVAPLRRLVSHALGIVRDGERLEGAIAALLVIAESESPSSAPAAAALQMALAALNRQESRGAHYRSDFRGRLTCGVPSRTTRQASLHDARSYVGAGLQVLR